MFPVTSDEPRNVVVLASGAGAGALMRGLLDQFAVPLRLTVIINAYDDGKSASQVRRDFQMLGPSDIGKNLIAAMSPEQQGCGEIQRLLETTLEAATAQQLWQALLAMASQRDSDNPTEAETAMRGLPDRVRMQLARCLREFCKEAQAAAMRRGEAVYDARGLCMRNVVFAGSHFLSGRNYQAAIDHLSRVLQVRVSILLNDTSHCHLAALTDDGRLLPSETAIIDDRLDRDIEQVTILGERLDDSAIFSFDALASVDEKRAWLRKRRADVRLCRRASEAIGAADLLILGPTTIESSLLPTLASKGCWEAIERCRGWRVFISNLVRERGRRTVADQLLSLESHLQQHLGADRLLHDVLDYVVIGDHGDCSRHQIGPPHVPVDCHELRTLGLLAAQDDWEDGSRPGQHETDRIATWLVSLMDEQTCRAAPSMKQDADQRCLARLLADPLSYHRRRPRIQTLVRRILRTTDLSSPPEGARFRVVIAANGQGARLQSDIPKPLYPIAGKPCLLHVAEKAHRIDPQFIVVANAGNAEAIRTTLDGAGYGQSPVVVAEPHGSGAAVLAAQSEMNDEDEHVIVFWSDAPNLTFETVAEAACIHLALGDYDATIPTTWSADPYAGVERDAWGEPTGMFQTKTDPTKRRACGEHDASMFIVKRSTLFDLLHSWQAHVLAENFHHEVDLLQALSEIPRRGGKIAAAALASEWECEGFNTVEEAVRVERLAQARERQRPRSEAAVPDRPRPTAAPDRDEMTRRCLHAMERHYRALTLDLDGNLLDHSGGICRLAMSRVVDFVRRGIPVALITGRQVDSAWRLFMQAWKSEATAFERDLLRQIYLYPANGAVAFRADDRRRLFYERPFPRYLSAAAMRVLREQLDWRDAYDVTAHKITIWPHATDLSMLAHSINRLLSQNRLPVMGRIGGPMHGDAVLILTESEVDKGAALADFSRRVAIDIDDIAKIADQGGVDGVDHPLLVGQGAFSTEAFDPQSGRQIALPLVCGQSNLQAASWALERLKVTAAPSSISLPKVA